MEENRLYTKQRRNEILRILREQGSISVNELSRQLQVSGTTIRLDLTDLEKTGILSRTHGGAIWNNTDHEPLIRERKNESQKNRIGKKAVSFISEHDTILIDTGTTMLSFAHALLDSECNHLIVYSNDLDVLRTLEEKEAFELHLLGGVLRNGFHYTYGNQVISELSNYHFNKLFLATSAISMNYGLTVSNSDLAMVKSKMVSVSETVFLLTDSTKIHHVAFQRFADLSDVNILIMDNDLKNQDLVSLQEKIPQIILV